MIARLQRIHDQLKPAHRGLDLRQLLAIATRQADREVANDGRELVTQCLNRRSLATDHENAQAEREMVADDVDDSVGFRRPGRGPRDEPVGCLQPAHDVNLIAVGRQRKEQIPKLRACVFCNGLDIDRPADDAGKRLAYAGPSVVARAERQHAREHREFALVRR